MIQDIRHLLIRETALPSLATSASINTIDFIRAKTKHANLRSIDYPQLYQEELCRLKRCCCACHETVSIQGRFWPTKLSSSLWLWKSCNKSTCRNARGASILVSLTQIGIPLAFCVGLEFMIGSRESYIHPFLNLPPVVRRTSPGFKLLWELQTGQRADWNRAKEDLLELFQTGKASPKDVDPDGETWLEVG